MSILFSHPTGNANVRSLSNILAQNSLMGEFHTTVGVFPGSKLYELTNLPFLKELRRRELDLVLKPFAKFSPWIEIFRQISPKIGLENLISHENGIFSIDSISRFLDKKVASRINYDRGKLYKAIYAYEDCALESFKSAKSNGLMCLYDLPIGYWRSARNFLEEEKIRWPEWANTITGFADSENKLARKDEELRLADRIFVASNFTALTLKDFPGSLAPIEVIPYGFPPIGPPKSYTNFGKGRKLKLLFVGGLTQRKGIADVFEIAKRLKGHVELTVVGRKTNVNCPALDASLIDNTWIPSLPHQDILSLMRQQDILIFPSLFEGFGLVITEAMSQGTPVITTDRTAGPDLISNGNSGWIVQAGDTNRLLEAVENILINPSIIEKTGNEAKFVAKSRPWSEYAESMMRAIINSLN